MADTEESTFVMTPAQWEQVRANSRFIDGGYEQNNHYTSGEERSLSLASNVLVKTEDESLKNLIRDMRSTDKSLQNIAEHVAPVTYLLGRDETGRKIDNDYVTKTLAAAPQHFKEGRDYTLEGSKLIITDPSAQKYMNHYTLDNLGEFHEVARAEPRKQELPKFQQAAQPPPAQPPQLARFQTGEPPKQIQNPEQPKKREKAVA